MIKSFKDEYAFLSNFYPSEIEVGGETYATVEHAFQAGKTLNEAERREIRLASTPGRAKRLGRKAALRPDWETFKFEWMETLLRLKFADPALAAKLKGTAPQELVEGNTWNDRVWGVCRGTGQNHLGRLLMKPQSWLREYFLPVMTIFRRTNDSWRT